VSPAVSPAAHGPVLLSRLSPSVVGGGSARLWPAIVLRGPLVEWVDGRDTDAERAAAAGGEINR